jgi:ribosomal protein S27E
MYREALQQTRVLYSDSGNEIQGSYGWLPRAEDPDGKEVSQQMEDLHQGFVMKVFAAVLPGVEGRTMEQRQLGRVLLEHIWGKSVMGNQLQEAVQWLLDASAEFRWKDLVRPFTEIPALRDRWGELETLAMRMANLVAAVDGSVSEDDTQRIAAISQHLAELGGRAAQQADHPVDVDHARDALTWLREEAKRLREGVSVTSAEKPTVTPSGPVSTATKPAATPATNTSAAAPDNRTPEQRLAEAREKLDRLIGLKDIKEQIQTLTNFLKMERKRVEAGLPTTQPTLHMSFVGNPGTGKTSVARIIAEIYGALGILKKGHLVETDRSGLVAEYAGQTGPKTNAKIDEALDGVLFIDEAYTLIDESGQDQYGREAVQTLLKRMEDQRDRLIVILAGYTNEMARMIRSNPGLSSRVGTTLEFADYSPEELCRIFDLIATKAKYTLPTESRRRLLRGFTYLYIGRDRHFGNGRTARNSFERSVRRLANRLASLQDITPELLTTLQPLDIEVADVSQQHLAAMADERGNVRVKCTHCDVEQVIDDKHLGTSVACLQCGLSFEAAWGAPVLTTDDATPTTSEAIAPDVA